MPVLFIHGAPETVQVWEPVTARLGRRDIGLLALPGFGTPLPDGFTPTMDAYASWLGDVVDRAGEVDLVAHDWGGLLALRVLSDQTANVRSWAVDSGDLSESFRWHRSALAWRGPDGEALRDWIVGAPDDQRAQALVGLGVPPPHASDVAAAIDTTMGDAMLSLYRSARDIGTLWARASMPSQRRALRSRRLGTHSALRATCVAWRTASERRASPSTPATSGCSRPQPRWRRRSRSSGPGSDAAGRQFPIINSDACCPARLLAEGTAIDLGGGDVAMLRGWHRERTLWLTPVLTAAEPLPPIALSDPSAPPPVDAARHARDTAWLAHRLGRPIDPPPTRAAP